MRNGVVDLWGVVTADRQRQAAAVVAENVPGVKEVKNHITWVEPTSRLPACAAELPCSDGMKRRDALA